MEVLKKRILSDGIVIEPDILKVDSFLNHQIDVALFEQIAKEFKRRFKDKPINKIVTIESSGIALAVIASLYFDHCKTVFVKKSESRIIDNHFYKTVIHSYTKDKDYIGIISKKYLNSQDHILIIDDFLANGEACLGIADLAHQAGAVIEGVGIVIEKGFQKGRKRLEEAGLQVESLIIVDGFNDGKVILR